MFNQNITPQQVLNFYKMSERLKSTLRHSWLSQAHRQESVAEHTWMMTLLALILLPRMQKQLNEEKVQKMIIIHDLAEAVTKDMPIWQGLKSKDKKHMAEKEAITSLFKTLDDETQAELFKIWEEYEERKSPESKFVKALDTLDVITQHNMAPIESWDDNDFFWQLSPLQDAFFDFDPFLRKIKNEIDAWSIEKVKEVDKLDKLDQVELKKRIK